MRKTREKKKPKQINTQRTFTISHGLNAPTVIPIMLPVWFCFRFQIKKVMPIESTKHFGKRYLNWSLCIEISMIKHRLRADWWVLHGVVTNWLDFEWFWFDGFSWLFSRCNGDDFDSRLSSRSRCTEFIHLLPIFIAITTTTIHNKGEERIIHTWCNFLFNQSSLCDIYYRIM